MPGEYRIAIGHATSAFVVEEPPLPHFSLERAHGVCTAQGWHERFLDLKRLAEGRERVNSMHLITERANPITNRPLQKPSARRLPEHSAVSLVCHQQVIGSDGRIGQIRQSANPRELRVRYSRQKPGKPNSTCF